MKTYYKAVRRSIAKSLGRFIALIAIVALGVGFLTGLLASTPNMKASVDAYYDDYNAADIVVKGGFSETELDKVKKTDGVKTAMAATVLDMPVEIDKNGKSEKENVVARVHMMDMTDATNLNTVNRLELLEGHFPKNENECVAERGSEYLVNVKIGDKIIGEKVLAEGQPPQKFEYEVTGIVGNSWYFARDREQTNQGNGRLGTIIYTNKVMPFYTDFFVTVKGASEYNAFSEAYTKHVEKTTKKIKETLGASDKIFVLDRNYNVGYTTFSENADKVAAVSVVFPAFFFLVAALVALTTMTRMIEEERAQIGTLKSLGYSNGTILSKYVIYCLLGGVVGCVVGVSAGFILLPAVIWNAYKFLYFLPQLKVGFSFVYAAISSLSALVAILFATVWACVKTLRERPSALMQPKAPKAGKRILLERIPFLWKHLKFKYKSTLRNLFRYKKHLIMTVLGIAGCTALVLTGFGLNDSTSAIANTQFTEIYKYELQVTTSEEPPELTEFLLDSSKVENFMRAHSENGYVYAGDSDHITVTLTQCEDSSKIGDYVRIKPRTGSKTINFGADSVVLTENTARTLGLKVGEEFAYERTDGSVEKFKLDAITENYVGSALYLGENVLENVNNNTVLANTKIAAKDYDSELTKILSMTGVTGAEFIASRQESYNNLLSSIGSIVAVLVVSAGGLAVIVLYNLINININERKKELATLKVLGYKNSEVAGYVFREIFILTILGVLVGFGVGLLLHMFVVGKCDTSMLMFGRVISPLSYLYSAVITLGFSALVDFIMYFKIKKIDMIESMKASE